MELTVDGKDEATVNALLKREVKQLQSAHKDGWEIFNQMGGFAPAFGMIGTDRIDPDAVRPLRCQLRWS